MTREEALENKIRIQKETKDSWLQNEGQGVAALATGVGKTKIGLDCLEEIRTLQLQTRDSFPTVLIVVPTEEMRDTVWPEEFLKWNVSTESVKIICYAGLKTEKLEKYDMLIFDECHRLTLPNLGRLELLLSMPDKPYCLGLTATMPKVVNPDDMERVHLLRELFPVIYSVTTDEAVELGLVADFEVHVLKFMLDPITKSIKGGNRVKTFFTTELAQYKYLTKNLQYATMQANADKKKEGFKFKAMGARTQFLYNLPSKERLARLCMSKLCGSDTRTILFAGSIEQANNLCGLDVYHSESNRDALTKFQAEEISLLGAVRALNEGINLTNIDNALIVQVDSVDRNLIQRLGRCIRIRYDNLEHKSKIIVLVASGTADEKWYQSAIQDFDSKRIKETLVRVPDPERR
jgi:superfamily II DNA or RNA helicase